MEPKLNLDLWLPKGNGDFFSSAQGELYDRVSGDFRIRVITYAIPFASGEAEVPAFPRSGKTPHPFGVAALLEIHKRTLELQGDAFLLIAPHFRPAASLFSRVKQLMQTEVDGWWFSVTPPPFYLQNLLVKEGHCIRYFEMEGLLSFDDAAKTYVNEITGKPFFNTQDGPEILHRDGAIFFVNMRRFKVDNPLPFECSREDYIHCWDTIDRAARPVAGFEERGYDLLDSSLDSMKRDSWHSQGTPVFPAAGDYERESISTISPQPKH